MQYNQLCLGLKTWSPCLGGVVACPISMQKSIHLIRRIYKFITVKKCLQLNTNCGEAILWGDNVTVLGSNPAERSQNQIVLSQKIQINGTMYAVRKFI